MTYIKGRALCLRTASAAFFRPGRASKRMKSMGIPPNNLNSVALMRAGMELSPLIAMLERDAAACAASCPAFNVCVSRLLMTSCEAGMGICCNVGSYLFTRALHRDFKPREEKEEEEEEEEIVCVCDEGGRTQATRVA